MSTLRRDLSGAGLITLGTLVGQGVVFLSTPFIARMYGPAALGEASIFLAVASVVTPLLSWRLEFLIPSAEDHELRWITRRAMVLIAAGATVATAGYGVVVRPAHLVVLPMFWLTAAGLAGIAVSMQLLIRHRVFRRIAAGKAVTGVGTAGVQLSAGSLAPDTRGLEIGFAAGYLLGWVVQRIGPQRALPWRVPVKERRRQIMLDGARLMAAGLLNVLSLWCILFSLGLFFSPVEAGLFSAVQRLVVTPVGLVVASVLPVVTGAVAASVREGRSPHAALRSWSLRLVPLGAAVTVVLLILPENLYLLILGDQFAGVRAYAAGMAVMVGAQIAVGPLGQVLVALKDVKTQLRWDLGRFALLVLAAAACAAMGTSAPVLVAVMSGVFAVSYGLFLVVAWRRAAQFQETSP